MHRTERLFALAEHLRARRTGVTTKDLAERFGVTERTIFRDLDALRAAHMPITAERGRGGGVALDRSYSLPPVNFSAREAAILVAAGRFLAEMRVIPFTDTLASALDKVRAALSTSSQRALLDHLTTLHFIGVPARTARPAVRQAIERAWFSGAPLSIRYAGKESTTERRVQIESVVMDRSETLLNVIDLDLGDARQLRFDRIERAEVVDAVTRRREGAPLTSPARSPPPPSPPPRRPAPRARPRRAARP
ncbi:MAG: HTH domain-containing protein [Byssovorax sp.]